MIVFFDVLLIDDNVCLRKPHRERRLLLKDTVRVIRGRADIAEQEIFDFARSDSQYRLERLFSKRIAERWEGYVLKGCDDPYFSIFSAGEHGSLGRWIKLKKDYIPGLGDTVDFAIIGGKYESRDAAAIKEVHKLSWTHFVIGCLINKEAVLQLQARPKFRTVDTINRHSMNRQNLQILNQFGEFSACGSESGHGFDIEHGHGNCSMDAVFKKPFVVEMMGSGFEKPSGARYFTLRFPRVVKIHWDRSFEDAASFSELQLAAEAARSAPEEDMDQEQHRWSKRLRLGDGSSQYIVDRSQSDVSTDSCESFNETASPERSISQDRAATSNCADGQHPHDAGDHARSRNEVASTDAIAIYVDQTVSSRSSSEESDVNRNHLTENENLSQRLSLAGSPPKRRNTELNDKNDDILSVNHSEKTDIPIPSTPEPRRKRKPSKAAFRTATLRQPPPESPLTTMPIYLHPSCSSACASGIMSTLVNTMKTTTNDLATFLEALTLETNLKSPGMSPQETTYGLICLNNTKTTLGTVLLHLGKALNTTMIHNKNMPPKQTKKMEYKKMKSKIFILDSTFLTLQTTSMDRRFCLQKTWEGIAREYFCACLGWEEGRGVFVSFEKRELGVLGCV